jgi:hypothetical protein
MMRKGGGHYYHLGLRPGLDQANRSNYSSGAKLSRCGAERLEFVCFEELNESEPYDEAS